MSLYFTLSPAATVSSASYKNDHVSSCFEHSSVPPQYFGKRYSRPLKIHPLLMLPARKPPLCDPSPRMQHSMSLPGPSAYWQKVDTPCLSTGCCQCCQAPCISMSHSSIPGPLCILHVPVQQYLPQENLQLSTPRWSQSSHCSLYLRDCWAEIVDMFLAPRTCISQCCPL